jgi:hypothetical protein
MLKLLSISIFLCFSLAAFAQVKPKKSEIPSYLGPGYLIEVPKKLDTTKRADRDFLQKLKLLRQSHFPVYSHSTPKGKVYRLPNSNMACLVPDVNLNAKMPGSEGMVIPPNNMPNPGKRDKIFPN